MHKILIYLHIIHLLISSTCFEHCPAHLQEVVRRNCIYAASGIVTLCRWLSCISNLMHKILIYLHIIHLLISSICFEHYPAHLQEVYVVIVVSVQDVQIKSGPILIWVIYLLRFTTCFITQLTCIYSKCCKWCQFISMHLSTRFTMFIATFLSVISFTSSIARVIFVFKILNFSKKLCLQWA